MKRLLLILALALAVCSPAMAQIYGCQSIPGDGVAVYGVGSYSELILANPVKDTSLLVELYAENFSNPGAGQPAIWRDASGQGNDASQTVDVNKPVASGTGVYFSGNNVGMSTGAFAGGKTFGNNSNTMVMLFNRTYTAGRNVILCDKTNGGAWWLEAWGAGKVWDANDGAYFYIASNTATQTQGDLFFAATFGTTATAQFNSGSIVSGNCGSSGFPFNSIAIGCQPSPYYITYTNVYAFLLYNRSLSQSEITLLKTYLTTKYRITLL